MNLLDPQSAMKALEDGTIASIKSTFPLAGRKQTLIATNVYGGGDADIDDIQSQKKARVRGRTWSTGIYGDFDLVDNETGRVVDKAKAVRLVSLPKITRRYSFIVDGTEYQADRQWRLKSGVYSRQKANGELEAHFNLEEGRGFRMGFYPEKRQFLLQYGSTNIQLLPVLRALGAKDEDIRSAWGGPVFDTVALARDRGDLQKLAKVLDPKYVGTTDAAATETIRGQFAKTALRPDTTKITLGHAFDKVDAAALTVASKKLLNISRGADIVDPRDSLKFKELWGAEDHVPERIDNSRRRIQFKLRNNVDRKENVKDIITTDVFNVPVKAFFTSTSLAQRSSQVNPIDMVGGALRSTIMGQGAIGSDKAVSNEAKSIDPSNLGFIDSIHTPEGCYHPETKVFTSTGWVAWPSVTPDTVFACRVHGVLEFHKASAQQAYVYSGTMYGVRTPRMEYLVTKDHRIYSQHQWLAEDRRWSIKTAAEVHGQAVRYMPKHAAYGGTECAARHVVFDNTKLSPQHNKLAELPIAILAQLTGWALSEGSFSEGSASTQCGSIHLFQSVKSVENCIRIDRVLAAVGLPVDKVLRENNTWRWSITAKPLWEYFTGQGKQDTRFIPEHFFTEAAEIRQLLFDTLLFGDGRKCLNHGAVQQVYTTTSSRLALDFERLAISLGHWTSVKVYADSREERYLDVYETRVLRRNYTQIHSKKPEQYYTQEYTGMVYCATVPGGLLYVKHGKGLAVWLGNSSAGIVTHLALGVGKRGLEPTTKVYNTKTKQIEERTPAELATSNLGFADQFTFTNGHPTPNAAVVTASPAGGGDPTLMQPSEVDYILQNPKGMFSMTANLIPFLPSTQANRAGMATRHMEQAISLKDREAPLVQVASGQTDDRLDTWEKVMGEFSSHKAPVAGKVLSVDSEKIVVLGADKQKHVIQLYDNFPLNDKKAFLHSEPLVKVGDDVEENQVIADSNFTRGGVLAIGTNLRVGYLNYRGSTFEDSLVVSESAAKRLTSEHMYKERVYLDRGMGVGLAKFRANYPGVVTEENAKKLDEDGVVKVGQTVQPGDVIMAVLKRAEPSPEQIMLKGIHKSLARPYRNNSVVWESEYPGVVTDVTRNGSEIVANIRTEEKVEVSDKLSGRYGNKGTISAVLADEEMPKNAAGEPLEIIMSPSGVPGRCYDAHTEFMTDAGWKFGVDILPTDVFGCFNTETSGIEMHPQAAPFYAEHYNGTLIECTSAALDFSVTPAHKMWCLSETPGAAWRETCARAVFGRRVYVPTAGAALELPGDKYFSLPNIIRNGPKDTAWSDEAISVAAADWAEFLGWYIAEGSFTWTTEPAEYRTHIAQSLAANSVKQAQIVALLNRLPFRWHYSEKNNQFHISSKRLTAYVRQLGGCSENISIPDWVFQQSVAVRAVFLAAYWAGDGNVSVDPRDGSTSSRASTTSRRLADDLQRLLVLQGTSSSVCPKLEREGCLGGWRVTRHVRTRRHTRGAWGTREYAGMVYCPTVPTGYVVTRRNGKLLIAGNTNPSQVLETALAKVAEKTGQPYAVDNFQTDNARKIVQVKGYYREITSEDGAKRKVWVQPHDREIGYQELVTGELAKHGLSATEELFDPATGKSFGQVMVGKQYILKLMHQIDKKFSARGQGYGNPYDANLIPKGEGAQRFGELGLYALLAHGSTDLVRDGMTYASDKQQNDVWTAIQTGEPLPTPKTAFAYDKFLAYLNAVGIDAEKHGNEIKLVPFTDAAILEKSRGELKDASKVLRGKDLKPEPGGLFDEKITGGPGGKNFSHVKLAERFPNPVFERAALSLLGITGAQFDGVIAGTQSINGLSGPSAIAAALAKLDLDAEFTKAQEDVKTARAGALDKANKKLKYLRALKSAGLTADQAYTLQNIPVIPPVFRPITAMEGGDLNVDGVNLLYRDVAMLNDKLKEGTGVLPPEQLAPIKKSLYDAMVALSGIDSVNTMTTIDGEVKPQGILTVLAGRTSPKEGYVHTKLMGRRQDLTMRSVISVDHKLSLDEVSLPRRGAMVIFKPFVVKEMVQQGYTPLQARDEVEKNTALANRALEVVVSKRPVLLKRDPVLHKFGILGLKVKLNDRKDIGIHPLHTGGLNADFDGDALAIFVPVSGAAVENAYAMAPSKNLFNAATGKVMYQPSLEGQLGLFLLSQFGDETTKSFATHEATLAAQKRGDIKMTDVVTSARKRTTAGRIAFSSALPTSVQSERLLVDPTMALDSKNLQAVMKDLALKEPQEFATSIDRIKNLGFGYSHDIGFSYEMNDFTALASLRDNILKGAHKQVATIQRMDITREEKDRRTVAIYTEATAVMKAQAIAVLDKNGNKMRVMNRAGVKPGWAQMQQILLAPMLMQNSSGRIIPTPVTRSYAEGVDSAGYWVAAQGARKGLVDKVLEVQLPGVLNKQLINAAIKYSVSENDCGTGRGITLDIDDADLSGRYVAKDIALGGTTYKAGTAITQNIADKLKQLKVGKVLVRSALKCQAPEGLCAKCVGLADDGKDYPMGTNIGVISSQAIGERGTQLSMRCSRHDTIVTYRLDGREEAGTLEDLFAKVAATGSCLTDGNVETAVPGNLLEVWDTGGWTRAHTVQRHPQEPDTQMVLVKTQLGGALVCQDNHPLFMHEPPSCVCHTPIVRQRDHQQGVAHSLCNTCKRFRQAPYTDFAGTPTIQLASDVQVGRAHMETDHRQLRQEPVPDPAVPGYIAGMYGADGCCRYGNGTPRYVGVPVAVTFAAVRAEKRARYQAALLREYPNIGILPRAFNLYGLQYGRLFADLVPGSAHQKRLCPEFLHFSDEWLAAYICGHVDGDGTVVEGPNTTLLKISTSSYAMLQCLSMILARLGIRATPGAATLTDSHVHQPWSLAFCVTAATAKWLLGSGRWCDSTQRATTNNAFLPERAISLVTLRRAVLSEGLVYDVRTDSQGFVAGLLRNHNSFHSGGLAGTGGGATGGIGRINELLKMPEVLPGRATLANISGRVDKITKSPVGGFDLQVGQEKHYVPHGTALTVKIGDAVEKGSRLSEGSIDPRELLDLTNMDTVQRYMSDELHDAYRAEGVKRRNAEVVVKSLTNLAKVTDPGDSDEFIRGDYIPMTYAAGLNKDKYAANPIQFEPVLRGLDTVPLDSSTDWMARLQYRRLKDTFTRGAQEGWKTDIHSRHPIPGIIYSAEFGKKDPTRKSPY